MNQSSPIQAAALTLLAMLLGLVTGLIPSFCIFRMLSNGTVDLTVPLVVGCSSLWVVVLHRAAKFAPPG